jgi:hypothetical protein
VTPLEFEELYHQLRITYVKKEGLAESRTVNVHLYRQMQGSFEFPEKDALLSRLDEELRRAGGLRMIEVDVSHRQLIADAFFGKGSPEACATTLGYALRYNRTRPEGLQAYCDQVARIGLDCNGFVNNYFRSAGRIQRDWSIEEYAQRTLRDEAAAIQPRDVLVWADQNGNVLRHPLAHIAVVATAPGFSGKAVVVESASSLHGLGHSTYTFTRVGRNLFLVHRPSGMSYVKVAQAP